jgi:hypothetical protein
MKPVIDDLPVVVASKLRSAGFIGRDTTSAIIRFDGSDVEYTVEVTSKFFPKCGGDWSMFRCHCGRRAQKLRLFKGQPTCGACLRVAGLPYRAHQLSHAAKRTAITAPKRLAMLNSDQPARVNPRKGRTLDGRVRIEAALRRSLLVARCFGVAEFNKRSKG